MIPEINLPQSQVTQYDRALSVMLYQYLRQMRRAINALLEATGVDFPIGTETLAQDAVAVTEAIDQPQTLRDRMRDEVMKAILVELRVMNLQLAQGLNLTEDLESMRSDPSLAN